MARLGGRSFAVVWTSTFCFYLGFQLLLPVIPVFAVALGGQETQVGLIIGVFAFSAMLLRPLAGDLADRIGRRPLVLAGCAIFAASSLGYAAVRSVGALLALRVFHGVGMGLGPTGATVMVTDLAPPDRRGAAMGLFGLTTAFGLAIGPYLGIELTRRLGFVPTFGVAAGIELVALFLALALPETRPTASPEGGARPSASAAAGAAGVWTRWLSRAAVYPSLLLLAVYFSYGGVVSFLPLFTEREGLGNPGVFFTVLALTQLVVRGPAGHLADRVGRRAVVAPAIAVAGLGLVALGLASRPWGLLGAAALYGVGFGAAQPALLAMTADRVPPEERGRALGTFYTAWELGISAGSVLLGPAAARLGYRAMWMLAAGIAGLGAAAATRQLGRPRG